jgi:Sporulation factor SpoIIGA.
VYIEEVLFHNLAINFILLKLAATLLRSEATLWRFILSAFIGAIFAVFLPFIGVGVFFYKLAALLSTTALFWRRGGVRAQMLFILTFSVISFAVGGGVYALYSFLDAGGQVRAYPHKGVIFAVFGVSCVVAYSLSQIRKKSLKRQISAFGGETADVVINEVPMTLRCLVDTGNTLTDDVTGKAVAVLSSDVGIELTGRERKLTVRTVVDSRELPLIRLDDVVINTPRGRVRLGSVPAVIGNLDGGCKLLLPTLCIEVKYEKRTKKNHSLDTWTF